MQSGKGEVVKVESESWDYLIGGTPHGSTLIYEAALDLHDVQSYERFTWGTLS